MPDFVDIDGDRHIRDREILSVSEMSAISGITEDYLRLLIQHGELTPVLHACSKPVPYGNEEEKVKARKAALRNESYRTRYVMQPARQTFDQWLKSPKGLSRLTSMAHRRQMENLRRGFPADDKSGGGPIPDSFLTDVKHDVDGGKSIRDSVLERKHPELAERVQAEAQPKRRASK